MGRPTGGQGRVRRPWPVAKSGVRVAHAISRCNLNIAIGSCLRGQPCRFFGSDLKIEVLGHIRDSDVFATCTPVPPKAKDPARARRLVRGAARGSGSTDRMAKNHDHVGRPSVQRYVGPAQEQIGGTILERVGGDGVGHLIGAETQLAMPETRLGGPMAEFYRGLAFDPDPVSATPSP